MLKGKEKSFPNYDRLANIFGKERATIKASQMSIDMTSDMNMDEANEEVRIEDILSPISVNQTIYSVNQSMCVVKNPSQVYDSFYK